MPNRQPYDPHPMFGSPVSPWIEYWAWLPVFTWDSRWRWLCLVERRLIVKHSYLDGGSDSWWQYRVRDLNNDGR